MSEATSHDKLVEIDQEFHELVATTAGNATLASMLGGVSSRTTRGRAWRGVVEAGATERTIAEHAAILEALRARDPLLAEAAALVHVSTTESWFRTSARGRGRRTWPEAVRTSSGPPRPSTRLHGTS